MHDYPLKICTAPTIPEQVIWTLDDEKFVRQFEQRVKDTIDQYDLFSSKDRIVVAVSGGKDSTVVLHILHKLKYQVEAVTVDAHIGCYTQQNLENIREVCAKLGVRLHEISFRKVFGASLCYIRDYLKARGHAFRSCTVCGVLRRYLLNRKARELGATKLVLGHNLDDEAQVILMNLFKNRPELNARLGAKIDNGDDRFVARVKPLYHIREDEVVRYSKLMSFPVKYGKCPCSFEGFRHAVRDFLNTYEQVQPCCKENIVRVFLEQRAKMRMRYAEGAHVAYCLQCDEPASDRLCRACALLALMQEPLESGQFVPAELPV